MNCVSPVALFGTCDLQPVSLEGYRRGRQRVRWLHSIPGHEFEQNWASLVAQRLKRLSAMQETWVRSLGWEDLLEKEMATHSSILAWRIPWTEKPGGLQSTGSQKSRTRLSDFTSLGDTGVAKTHTQHHHLHTLFTFNFLEILLFSKVLSFTDRYLQGSFMLLSLRKLLTNPLHCHRFSLMIFSIFYFSRGRCLCFS